MKHKLLLFLVLFGLSVSAIHAATPSQYQAVEKELKKQHKKVIFADQYFKVQDKKTKKFAAATLDGKVFTPYACPDYFVDQNFSIVSLCGRDYLKAPIEYSKYGLFSLDGEQILNDSGELKELSVGDRKMILHTSFNVKEIFDPDFRQIFAWEKGKLKILELGDEFYFQIGDFDVNGSGYAVDHYSLYSVNGTLLREDYAEVTAENRDGMSLLVFKENTGIRTAAQYNPVAGALSYVFIDDLNGKPVVMGDRKFYRNHGGFLYEADGRKAFEYAINFLGPDFFIYKGKDGAYGAMDFNFNTITPAKWRYLSAREKGKYRWLVACDITGNTYKNKHPEEFISVVLDFQGNEYRCEVIQGAPIDAVGNSLTVVHGNKRYPVAGASLKKFAYTPIKANKTNNAVATASAPKVSKDFPSLEIVEGSVRFVDPSGRKAINAEGAYAIEFEVRNTGKGYARGCTPVVGLKSGGTGVTVGKSSALAVAPGGTVKVSVPVNSSLSLAEGIADFVVRVDEPNGFGTGESLLSVTTHSFEAPRVLVNDYTVTSQSGATLQKKTPFDLQVLIQNVSHGRADDVAVTVHVPENVFVIEGNQNAKMDALQGGQTKELVYTLVANNNYASEKIPIQIDLLEKHGKYAESRRIELTVNQPLTASRIVVDEASTGPKGEIEIARLNSDVDMAIPAGSQKAENTFAVIIANENYSQVAAVPHAANDGRVFAEYCRTTLGIPEKNIRTVTNGTLNEMKRNLNWLAEIGRTVGDKANLIFYYSGHGVPDESTGQAYILPVDGYHSDMSTNLAVGDLYKLLNESGAGRITVFMDACFSGARRGDGMLMAARGVQIKAKTDAPKGNMIVFSAAQGDETAYPYDSQNHGLFTYYLLKKLQQTGGKVSLGELSDYITEEVKRTSLLENSKIQTPQVQISPAIAEDWRQMPL